MNEKREIVIEIQLGHRLIGALATGLLVLGLPSILALSDGMASAALDSKAAALAGNSRMFYLSEPAYGSIASGACSTGYHMASFWEIADPSNLQYDTSLGYTTDDSGQGPPNNNPGWVRTGNVESTSDTPGQGNCDCWSVHGFYSYGSAAQLSPTWNSGTQDLGVWELTAKECSEWVRVWCIEDL